MGESGEAVSADEVGHALRRLRREQYRIDTAPDGTRLTLLMSASPAGRRNAADRAVAALAAHGLGLDADDPVLALADGPGSVRVVRA